MVRTKLFILLIIAMATMPAMAAAPTAPPSPPPPASPPSSPTSPSTQLAQLPAQAQELLQQAIDAMRVGQLDASAAALMAKAYNATPPAQRTRPLILDRAIVDLTQRVNVMRAVRDVSQYLRDHPEPDEEAQNILGAALNIAAGTPRWKQGTLWQSAYREWERRDNQMTAARPGYRRWGPHWLEEAQYAQLQSDITALQTAIDDQAARVTQAMNRADALRAQHQALGANAQAAGDQANAAWQERRDVQRQQNDYEMKKLQYEQQRQRWQQQQQQKPPAAGGAAPTPTPAPAPAAPSTSPPALPPVQTPLGTVVNSGTGTGGGGGGGLFTGTTGLYQEQARLSGELLIVKPLRFMSTPSGRWCRESSAAGWLGRR